MENDVKNVLYGWVFTYNPFTSNWRACKRDVYLKLFDAPESEFIRSKDLDTLISLVIKTQGEEEKIKKLVK